jgi:hypothetical protein
MSVSSKLKDFFLEERLEEEYRAIEKSKAIVEEIHVKYRYFDGRYLFCLREFVKNHRTTLKKVVVDVALPLESQQPSKLYHLTYKDFYIPFCLFDRVEVLIFRPQNIGLCKKPIINESFRFPELRVLELSLHRARELECLKYFDAPKLEDFQIETSCRFRDLPTITGFLNRNNPAGNLRSVSIRNDRGNFKLIWNRRALIYKIGAGALDRKDIRFIVPWIQELREFKATGLPDPALFELVVEGAKNLETVRLKNLEGDLWSTVIGEIPSVAKLALNMMEINESLVRSLADLFPGVKEMEVKTTVVGDCEDSCRKYFQKLEIFKVIEAQSGGN